MAEDPARDAHVASAIAELPRSSRYRLAGALATGGMGEVLVAHDLPLARDVVVKRMRSAEPAPETVRRFLREARIQGRLQHPAIVPVHDLAVDAEGRPFFAMKQITGTTLADILVRQRAGAEVAWSRAALLRAFIDICLAIELAHTRGVVHRDLKPSNVALGDFGEVYVLDWGVARILGDDHSPDHPDSLEELPAVSLEDWQKVAEALPGATLPGSLLGTPGYMAPEQVQKAWSVGPPADVYALGAILFEILAGEPLHARSGALVSTVMGVDGRPSLRASATDVSPELDAICVRATAKKPADRFPSARALADAVQRYLDGDRDVARRKELADQHLAEARAALAHGDGDEDRRTAVRAAGRALALDPSSVEAAEIVTHLVVTPPKQMPAELVEQLAQKEHAELLVHARGAALGIGTFALYLPVFAMIGVKDWAYMIVIYVTVAAGIAYALTSARLPSHAPIRPWVMTVASAVLVALFSRLIGPFVLPAGIATVSLAISMTHPRLMRRPWLLIALFVVAALGPWGLELAGVLQSTYHVTTDGYYLTSPVLEVSPVSGQLAIAGFILSVVVVMGVLSLRVARLNRRIRNQLEVQAWHLRQLVPATRG